MKLMRPVRPDPCCSGSVSDWPRRISRLRNRSRSPVPGRRGSSRARRSRRPAPRSSSTRSPRSSARRAPSSCARRAACAAAASRRTSTCRRSSSAGSWSSSGTTPVAATARIRATGSSGRTATPSTARTTGRTSPSTATRRGSKLWFEVLDGRVQARLGRDRLQQRRRAGHRVSRRERCARASTS